MFWKFFLERRWLFISCFLFTVSCSQSFLFPVSKSPVSTFDTFLNFHSFQPIFSFHFPAFSQPISCRECWFFENTTHYSEELDGTPCRRRMARFRAISRSIDEVHFWVVSKKMKQIKGYINQIHHRKNALYMHYVEGQSLSSNTPIFASTSR